MASRNQVDFRELSAAFAEHVKFVKANRKTIAWQPGDDTSVRDYLEIAEFFVKDLAIRADGEAVQESAPKAPAKRKAAIVKAPAAKPAAVKPAGTAKKPPAVKPVPRAAAKPEAATGGRRRGQKPVAATAKRTKVAEPVAVKGAIRSKPATVVVPA